MSNRKVLVTGANGFLGGHLCIQLKEAGWEVFGTDSHGNKVLGDRIPHPSIVQAVVHLAWYSSAGDKHPKLQQHCLDSTKSLLKRCSPGVPFVFASTASVYGDGGDREFKESDETNPNCAYSRAKMDAEGLVRQWQNRDKQLIFRFGSMMGRGITRTKTEVCVNGMASEGWTKGIVEVWNPESWKPLIHVRDAAELILEGLDKKWSGTVNAACCSMKAIDVAGLVQEVTGAVIDTVEDRTGPRSCRLDCTKMAEFRGQPFLKRGVLEAIEEFRDFTPDPSNKNVPWEV